MATVAIILAAGLGQHMKSSLPKALHPVLGDPALLWVLRSLPASVNAAVVVVQHGKEQVLQALDQWIREKLLPCPVTAVDQGEPMGAIHAVRVAVAELDRLGAERVLILSGDAPLVESATLERLASGPAALLAMEPADPARVARVRQNADGTLASLLAWEDASEEVRGLQRVDGGVYSLPWRELKTALADLGHDDAPDTFSLADAVVRVARKTPVAVSLCDPGELAGMHSRSDQAALQAHARQRINERWMDEGVTFLDPVSTLVGPRVTLARDVLLEPSVRLEGTVTVGEGTRIGQGCVIRDCAIAGGVEIRPYCVLQQSNVSAGARLGPFAHLREGSVLLENVHVGNFVETKKATLHAGAKANHLSYLGDAEVGERTNIGAGFISCNYDGFNKHRTVIGRDVFVGSDVQLVAPVVLGDGAIIGAGSTITQDIPANALALTRAPITVREGAAERLREKLRAKKRQG